MYYLRFQDHSFEGWGRLKDGGRYFCIIECDTMEQLNEITRNAKKKPRHYYDNIFTQPDYPTWDLEDDDYVSDWTYDEFTILHNPKQ